MLSEGLKRLEVKGFSRCLDSGVFMFGHRHRGALPMPMGFLVEFCLQLRFVEVFIAG